MDEIRQLVSEVQARRIFKNGFWESYRGQGRPEYKLIPSIARGARTAQDVRDKENNIINNLPNALQAAGMNTLRVDNSLSANENNWNILMQAQHLGLPTRLLDWSLKWEVALWFAVENSQNDDVDGQFWVFSVPDEINLDETSNSIYTKDLTNLDKTYYLRVPLYWTEEIDQQTGEVRRWRQYGRFSISPYDKSLIALEDQPELAPYLEKYCIPAAIKKQLRLELESMGLHADWLYYRESESPELRTIIDSINKL